MSLCITDVKRYYVWGAHHICKWCTQNWWTNMYNAHHIRLHTLCALCKCTRYKRITWTCATRLIHVSVQNNDPRWVCERDAHHSMCKHDVHIIMYSMLADNVSTTQSQVLYPSWSVSNTKTPFVLDTDRERNIHIIILWHCTSNMHDNYFGLHTCCEWNNGVHTI